MMRQLYASQGPNLLACHCAVSADRRGIFIERSSCVLQMQVLIHPVSIGALLMFVAVIVRVWRLYRS
jgi:sulfur relay (sulfurtransferase) complex TusBCD TusD component (DsrE family)